MKSQMGVLLQQAETWAPNESENDGSVGLDERSDGAGSKSQAAVQATTTQVSKTPPPPPTFKSSQLKRDFDWQVFATNLHLSRFRARKGIAAGSEDGNPAAMLEFGKRFRNFLLA